MLFSRFSAKPFSASAIAAGLLACASFSPCMARAQSPNASDHFRVLLQYPNPTDAGGPTARLLRDDEGNLYGVGGGGNGNDGVVFKLSPGGQETVLYSFNGTDGSYPKGGLVRDADGNLYGTTAYGGPKGYGTVFKLTPDGVFTVLHKFHGAPDGATPWGDLLLGADGNIYGTTTAGGTGCPNPYGPAGCGTVFKITPAGKESILYRFTDSPDGAHPEAGLVADADGNLYGATGQGASSTRGSLPSARCFVSPLTARRQSSIPLTAAPRVTAKIPMQPSSGTNLATSWELPLKAARMVGEPSSALASPASRASFIVSPPLPRTATLPTPGWCATAMAIFSARH